MTSKAKSPLLSVHEPVNNARQLRLWIKQHLNLTFPERAMCPNHCSPFEYLRLAYFEPASDLVVWAPRGGGKTRLGAAATLLDLLHKPGVAVRILGGSLEQSLRMWEHLLPDVESLAHDLIEGKPKARSVRLKNGAHAGVITQSQRSVRGLRVQKLRCDEVEMFDPDIWEAAQLSTRSLPGENQVVRSAIEAISTFHQPGGLMSRIIENASHTGTKILHWCILDVLEKCPPARPCDGCALYDECQGRAKNHVGGFLSIDDAIKMKKRVSLETWQSEMLCRRPSLRGLVFGVFNPEIHLRESLPAGPIDQPADPSRAGLCLSLDFGYNNPFVCLWIRRDAQDQVHVIDEYIQSGMTIHEHIKVIQQRPHGVVSKVYCDPAGNSKSDQTGRSNVQALQAAGYIVRSKGSQIVDGIELVRAAFKNAAGQSSLFIHPRCQRLITALQSYRYNDQGGELPIKDGVHDHPLDALRYFFVNHRRYESRTAQY